MNLVLILFVAIAALAGLLAGIVPGLLITTGLGAFALLVWLLVERQWQHLGDVGQGLLGFASVFALVIGALLYYQAGRDRARIEARAAATVVPLPPQGEMPRVLVQVAGTVTNRGESRETFQCVGVDVRGFGQGGEITRNAIFRYDVNTDALLTGTAGGPQWSRCVGRERSRWDARETRRLQQLGLGESDRWPFHPPNSGHRFEPIELLPGESRTFDLELVVPCTYSALRLHFLVPRPDTDVADEAKSVFPIIEECRRSGDSARRTGVSTGGGSGR